MTGDFLFGFACGVGACVGIALLILFTGRNGAPRALPGADYPHSDL